MEAGNAEAFAEVEGVGVVAVGAGVEGEGGAGVGAGVVDEPAEHGFAVAEGAGGGEGDEVVDIEGLAGGEHELDAKAGDGGDGAAMLKGGEVVALGLLGADAGEQVELGKVRAELDHDGEAAEDGGVGDGEVDGGHELFGLALGGVCGVCWACRGFLGGWEKVRADWGGTSSLGVFVRFDRRSGSSE